MKNNRNIQTNDLTFRLANAAEQCLIDGNKSNLKTLYDLFGARKPHGERQTYYTTPYRPERSMPWLETGAWRHHDFNHTFRILTDHLNLIRNKRKDRMPEPVKTLTQKYFARERFTVTVTNGPSRIFCGGLAFMRNHIREWKRGTFGDCIAFVTTHTSMHNFSGKVLHYTPHMNKMRRAAYGEIGDAHIPIIATDRFILDYILHDKPYVPSFIGDGDVVQVKYIAANPVEVVDGYLAKVGTEFGCARTKNDAVKAAKMRTVRKTKKALGLL